MTEGTKSVLIGELLKNRYKIISFIGAGGMAEVYLAHDNLLDRDVAVKILRKEFVGDRDMIKQFRREATSAARLVHPNIINIYDVVDNENEQYQYIVMEYVQGTTLKEILRKHRLSARIALEIAAKLANALEYAHNRNIIHCDIKPQNILINRELTPKIADFGIAKIISNQTVVFTGDVVGSVHYLSPEQAGGGKITAASDVYSLGIVLFEMLTGEVPYTGATAVTVTMMHSTQPIPHLSEYMQQVPAGLQEIIDKAMAKRPENRYANAGLMRRDLQSELAACPAADSEEIQQMNMLTAFVKQAASNNRSAEEDAGTTMVVNRSERKKLTEDSMTATKVQTWEDNESEPDQQTSELTFLEGIKEKLKLGSKLFLKSKETKDKRENRHKRFNWTRLLIMVTACVVLISIGAHFFFSSNSEPVEVPDVVKMTVDDAQSLLEDKNFRVELENGYSSDNDFPLDTVLQQSVKPGEKRRENTVIILTVNKGTELRAVPDLIGMSITKAENVLIQDGFAIGNISYKYVHGERIGSILETFPKGLGKVAKGSSVDLVVCQGDRPVPDIIGKTLLETRDLLNQAGLGLGKIMEVEGVERKGTVKSAYPSVGEKLGAGDLVDVYISAGPVIHTSYVEFRIPNDKKRLNVEIILNDINGRVSIYKGSQRGGARVRQKVVYVGTATLTLLCDGEVVEEKVL